MAKTFKQAPTKQQPSPEAIKAFEAGGPGTDNGGGITHIPTNEGNAVADEAEPTKRLSLDLPQSVHRRFKTACSATDTKMVREIMQFIDRRTGELEEQAGFSIK